MTGCGTPPGEASVCLPGSSGAYTEEQIRSERLPLLGLQVALTDLKLRDARVLLEGRATDADAKAALDRIRQQAPWLQVSSTAVGKGSFWARLSPVCAAPPPRQGGLCLSAEAARR